ncbi:MAG TPA: hypothetical protein VK369_04880 [Segetibacter sp.]|nr:hypothetical protein [Segetibacter sp.]
MEQEQKTSPVEIVQKLIAIHTTRKEASEKMGNNSASLPLQGKLESAAGQSDRFIKALLSELSQFGDAVQSEVNRDDDYQQTWNNAIVNIDTIDASALSDTHQKLENTLLNIYSEIIDSYQDLPVSLNDLLISQLKELKQTL